MSAKAVFKRWISGFYKTIRVIVIFFGIGFILMIGLSLTEQPFWMSYYLGTANSVIQADPDYIVIMGAGAMPGPKGLMRCYFGAQAARRFPEAKVIIAMPAEPGKFLGSDPYKMYEATARYGIDDNRFIFEVRGTDSHSQAVEVFKILKKKSKKNLLIVTSPEHMFRCILTFEKCGFENVDGTSTFSTPLNDNLLLSKEELESENVPLARNITMRYNMWNYLKLEIEIMREIIALAYYKVKGYV